MRLISWRAWLILGLSASLLPIGVMLAQTVPAAGSGAVPAERPLPLPAAPLAPAVMIDPAHGGSESGAVLNPLILEKDVNLAFGRLMRQDLTARGVLVRLMREGDVNLSTDDRAAIVNSAHPLLYVCLHASSEIGGVRIFSAMLPPGADNSGPFVDWATAQSRVLSSSRELEQQLAMAVQKSGIPARALIAPLKPLNNVVVPALAIEISPTTSDVSQLVAADFQQKTAAALSNAIAAMLPAIRFNSGVPH